VYADITLENVALDTPNNVAVFVTDAPAKCASMIYPLSKLEKPPHFPILSHDCQPTQSLMY
jgi:hypothetical protein